MNKKQQAQYDSSIKAKDFFTQNSTALSTIPDFAAYETKFNNLFVKVTDAINRQVVDTTVAVPEKEIRKLAMAEITIKFASRGAAKANLLGKTELELGLSKSLTYIIDAPGDTAAARAYELKELMKNNLTILDTILATDIADIELAIKNFNLIKPVPKELINIKKTQGTDPIPILLSELEDCKKQITKLIHSYLSELAPTWDAFIKIGTVAGTRKLSICIRYTDFATDANIKNVKATIASTVETIIRKSTRLGYIRVYSMLEGNYNITSEYTGYETDTKTDIGIKDKKIVRLNIKLKKALPSVDPETTTGILSLIAYDNDTHQPMAGVLNSIPELEHSNTTDEEGEDYRDEIAPGEYQGTLFLEGYKPNNYTFTIEAGKTTTLQLYMEKEPV